MRGLKGAVHISFRRGSKKPTGKEPNQREEIKSRQRKKASATGHPRRSVETTDSRDVGLLGRQNAGKKNISVRRETKSKKQERVFGAKKKARRATWGLTAAKTKTKKTHWGRAEKKKKR